MRLADVAPRLAAARDQMEETERVLGWLRDASWMGGAEVLVSVCAYTRRRADEWVRVDHVIQGDASPYPIRGDIKVKPIGEHEAVSINGQWAFWEVMAVRPLSEDYPEILEHHPDFPRPMHLDMKPGDRVRLLDGPDVEPWHPHPMRTCPTSWAAGVNQGVIW